jgi:hypothetical protein
MMRARASSAAVAMGALAGVLGGGGGGGGGDGGVALIGGGGGGGSSDGCAPAFVTQKIATNETATALALTST